MGNGEKSLVYTRYSPDPVLEREWLDEEETKSLIGAAIFIPEGTELSDDAIETIRHFRYYRNAKKGFVLFADRVLAFVDAGSIDDMVEKAKWEAGGVLGSMPDFTPYDMDDGCGMLHMTNANIFAFRPFELASGLLYSSLIARDECLEACQYCDVVAVVYCNENDYVPA